MPATSLKLSVELKQRIAALVADTDQSAHAFMVEAIERVAQRQELRRRFGADAAAAEQETAATGKAYDAAEVFDHLEARARGENSRRPQPQSWPKSA